MYVRGEIAYRGCDALVECASEGQVSAEAHACCADAAVAGGEGEEGGDGEDGVFVVGVDFLRRFRRQFRGRSCCEDRVGEGHTFSILYLFPSSVPGPS